jgi:hypothetical protein
MEESSRGDEPRNSVGYRWFLPTPFRNAADPSEGSSAKVFVTRYTAAWCPNALATALRHHPRDAAVLGPLVESA